MHSLGFPRRYPCAFQTTFTACLIGCLCIVFGSPTAVAVNAPVVANAPAIGVQSGAAVLGGQTISTGGENPAITIFYGPTDGGTNGRAWAQSIALGTQAGAFSQVVAGLSPNTTYFFTVQGVNSGGTGWATPSQTFTTLTGTPYAYPTYHYDNTRQGAVTNEAILNLVNVNSNRFQKLFTNAVDGVVYAQPLVMTNVMISGKGAHNVVIVATEHDSVYAFDADNNTGPNATALWQTSFINPAANVTTIPNSEVNSSDITPEIGITGTPVIDAGSGTVYVEAKTKEVTGGVTNYVHRLHALDITTGLERTGFNSPVVITVSGWNALRQHDRSALTLLNGVVYIPYASHGDNQPYHGWLLAYNATNLSQQLGAYNSTPTGSQGGFWDGGGGPSIDAAGNLYIESGNGTFDGANNFAMSVIKLSTNSGLSRVDYFTPFNESALNSFDQDLGAGAALILPDLAGSAGHPHLVVAAGKSGEGHVTPGGKVYLIDRDNMGQFNATSDDSRIVQVLTNAIGGSYSTPAFWNNILYYGAAKGDTLKAFTMSGGLIQTPPVQGPAVLGGGFGATPVISANGTNNGIVWLIEENSPAVLHAYNAVNVAIELYNSSQNLARDNPGNSVKFSAPAVANGKVYMGTKTSLAVFGAIPNTAVPLIAPNGGVFFTNQVSVTLSAANPGASIYYTLDGTLPTTNSTRYTNAFILTNNTTVIAKAVAAGFNDSAAASAKFSLGSFPTFNSVSFSTNGVLQLSFSGVSGETYILQASTDLMNWTPISTNVAPANLFNFTDPNAANFSARFYRVVELP